MRVIYSEQSRRHDPEYEFRRSKRIEAFENVARSEAILSAFARVGYGQITPPDAEGAPINEVHDSGYLAFLRDAYARWHRESPDEEILPYCWPNPMGSGAVPTALHGEIGYYAGDADTPIVEGTWDAARAAASCAATAARRVSRHGDPCAFALTRPPGHHASSTSYAGYCYLNNAAIACTQLRNDGMSRVALLDIDYHHGNGSQAIFESRSDVLFASIHADPDLEYPYYSGRRQEMGLGAGEGFTINHPLPPGSDWAAYQSALEGAIDAVRRYAPDGLVVSMGLDTAREDPLGTFGLRGDHYAEVGRSLARLHVPSVFVLEGGYAHASLGEHAFRVLSSFEREWRQ